MSVDFRIPGPPRGKGRPRFFQRSSGGVGTYTPDATASYENLIKTLAMIAMKPHGPFRGAVALTVVAVYPIPASKSKKEKAAMRDGRMRPTGKPDLDNVLKALMDGMNGVVFEDDKQVTDLHATRIYGDEPELRVRVEPRAELPTLSTFDDLGPVLERLKATVRDSDDYAMAPAFAGDIQAVLRWVAADVRLTVGHAEAVDAKDDIEEAAAKDRGFFDTLGVR